MVPVTEGIDVSHWQGTIDWTLVQASGKRFAYIKASEDTTFVDPGYLTNRAQARAVGAVLNRPASAYRYVTPYNDLMLLPLMALIRYHDDPVVDVPPQVIL